ncbi:metallophosphoesterase family protein [Luteolibacter sp. GHJ8]|uniref:Metallophosphoesterase family protein n=1 Tax=Luteolibacter rhizosphaerae TaxID=2989719 RepID=A0ABT3G1D6_9BACT|nr:metallophosphoesterase [Luteolibacter rhizosphaerae]MCW1913658.1 metallophosphoesterase family protein [Luteolibacter rhizosphaerae]
MTSPVRILSDLHLGHRVSRIASVEQLRPLIAGAGTVVFNGDTWQELAAIFREKSAVMLEELKALCAQEGAEMIFLSGNHDPGWDGPGWVELAGGKILITHGDAFYAEGSPWSREAFARHEQVAELWAQHGAAAGDPAKRIELARKIALVLRAATYPKGQKIWQRVMEAVRPPRRAYEILRVWTQQADAAADFAARYFPKAEIVVMGHFHRTGMWRRGNKLILNLGAFLPPGAAWWAEYEGGYLRVGKIDEGEIYQRREVLGVWRIGGNY